MAMQSRYIYSGTKEHPVYVDCVKASHSSGKWPIVMLHGGFHNGSAYLSTPDGRDGWADEFARRGHDVFVMDWPGHGRSPSSACFVDLSMVDVGRSLGVLLSEIGPAIVFAHSASGPIAWWVAENFSAFVKAVVGIAPGAPANLVPVLEIGNFCNAGANNAEGNPIISASDRPAYVDRDFILKFWANSPRFPNQAFESYARSIGHESPRILNERFNIGASGLYLKKPEKLKDLPILIITGELDPRHPREMDWALAQFLGADFIWLPDLGIRRNGHMLMIEDNHTEIAGHIGCWLDSKIP